MIRYVLLAVAYALLVAGTALFHPALGLVVAGVLLGVGVLLYDDRAAS